MLIAITGGIGSGKSVVARMLACMGLGVYDTDAHARRLMHTSAVRETLENAFGSDIYDGEGNLRRSELAARVFGDPVALQQLNAIVHPAVKADVTRWAATHDSAFVETALLEQSGMRAMVDGVWQVTAPVDVRVARVMARNGMSEKEVRQRIAAQQVESHILCTDRVIVNDNARPLLPQVLKLLTELTSSQTPC